MWTRALLKENAKIAFKRNYWTCVFASVILMLLGAGAETSSFNLNLSTNASGSNTILDITGRDFMILLMILFVCFIVMIISLVFAAFITNVLQVGGKRYFMENREHKTALGQIFYGFQCGNYMNIVKTMFLRGLYIFGWSLLLVIPGIIKSYAYLLVPYILAENPDMTANEAIGYSNEMMKGYKLEAFVLSWSFIGWDILNTLTVGILGVFYVNPYKHATWTEFYTAVKADAFDRGIIDPAKFPGVAYKEFQQEFQQDFVGEATVIDESIFEEE